MKKRFKLYKSGKRWLRATVITVGIVSGLCVVNTDINADTNLQNVMEVPHRQDISQSGDNIESFTQPVEISKNENAINSSVDRSQPVTPQGQTNQPLVQNGWSKNEQGQLIYYQEGHSLTGRQYINLPSIPATNVQSDNNWYLLYNGIAQSGVQQWAGSYYYFDPVTYLRVDNDYRQSQWGDWYLFGNDGRVQSGVQQWAGTYYYFDPNTYLRVDNDYRQSQWGDWYMFGPDGRIVTKVYQWAGSYYYFDPVTYLRVDNDYRQSQWGDWYLFGNDGRIQSGVQQWAGTYYYFDPVTYLRVDNDYRQSQWGDWYMFGKDGKIVTGLYDYNGNTYYANPVTYLREKNTYVQTEKDGRGVLLGNDGAALSGVQSWNGAYYYFDPATHLLANKRNYVQSQWGDWYLIGDNGQVLSGLQEWYGNYYYFDPITFLKVTNQWRNNQYFGPDGIRYQNQFLNDRGRLYRFDANGNMLTNRWFNDDAAKKSYYFGADGVAYTGRHVINGVTYVFNDDGVRIETIK